MSVKLEKSTLENLLRFLALGREKCAFQLPEFVDVGTLFKEVSTALDPKSESLELTDQLVKFSVVLIRQCAERIPLGFDNLAGVQRLVKELADSLPKEVDEETKSE